MERDIKPTYDELESYVENLQKQLADAQATVAALQARVKELCKFRQADHEQLVEVQKYWRESQDEVHELQSQLTQRTAECDALKLVNDTHMKTVMKLSHIVEQQTAELEAVRVDNRTYINERHENMKQIEQLQADLEQRTAELEAANKLIYKKNCDLGRAETINNDLQAELERVRGERDEARDRSYDEMTMAYCQLAHEIALPGTPLPTNTNDSISFGKLREVVESVVAHLTRVRDQYADLRKMVLALPKVEGEIYEAVASYRYDKAPEAWFHCESQLIALLQHRQGMEG